ncbi:thermonuclease family protein [Synechococcus sp. RS9907]|uniref:thermonuclease family protein n=1 Tax=Synechococcus sp. RS9907 TaxID=221350 RepID=UPI00165DE49E|nr:thermonuclease family protein [Synechococcus sp. RS9907]
MARITGIVDGDSFTVSVKGEEKSITLANIDPISNVDVKAENYLSKLLKVGQRINLQEFGENDNGETIANTYKGRKGKDIALTMVKKGFAEISDEIVYRTDLKRLAKFELKAQKLGKGIWADLGEDNGDEADDDVSDDFMEETEEVEDALEEEMEEVEVEQDLENDVEDSLVDLIDKLQGKLAKAGKKLEEKREKLYDKLGLVDSDAAAMVIKAHIEKAEEKVSRLEEKLESAIQKLEKSDSLTGLGSKKSGSPLEGLEILSAEINDGQLLVKFSDDITFQEYGKKRFKSFLGHKRLNMKKAEILGSDLIGFDVPLKRQPSHDSFFKMFFAGKGKGNLDYLIQESTALIAEIETV